MIVLAESAEVSGMTYNCGTGVAWFHHQIDEAKVYNKDKKETALSRKPSNHNLYTKT